MKLVTLALLFLASVTYSQEAVHLIQSSVKLNGHEKTELYFGLAEGDQLILDFSMKKGKNLSEIEISEHEGRVIFSDAVVKKLKNRILQITASKIYKFRFSNLSSRHRIISFTIKRIPKNESLRNYNSTVSWRTSYDTIYKEKEEKYLIRKDTSIVNLLDQVSKVHSQTNMNGNTSTAKFKLPQNTVSWAYYIDVEQAGQKAFQEAASNLARLAPKIAAIPEVGPVAAIALGVTGLLPTIQNGEDINFYITDYDNAQLFLSREPFNALREGLIINAFGKMTPNPDYNGYYYICLHNDNAVTGVSVTLKVSAIVVKEEWGNRTLKIPVITERKEAYLVQ